MFEDLLKLGFSDREASVYLMLLRMGPSPVSSLAKRVEMKRVSVYTVLEGLAIKGLVAFEDDGPCRRYIPYDPECLIGNLDREKARLKYRLEIAKECVAKLQKKSLDDGSQYKSTVVYRGIHLIESALQETFKTCQGGLFFVVEPAMNETFKKHFIPILKSMTALQKSRLSFSISEDLAGFLRKYFPESKIKISKKTQASSSILVFAGDVLCFLEENQDGFVLNQSRNTAFVEYLHKYFETFLESAVGV